MIFNPSADTIIEEHDALVVVGSHNNLEALEKMANPGKTTSGIAHQRR